jgi:hypothetical protein
MIKLLISFTICFRTVSNTSSFPCADYEVIRGVELYGTLTLEECDCSASRPAALSLKKQPRYPLNRTLDEPPDPSGHYTEHKQLLPMPRIEARLLGQIVCYFSNTNYAPWAQGTL